MIGRITRWVLSVSIVGLAAWATVAAIWGADGDSISAHVRDYAAGYPLVAVGLGVLVGHWIWPMSPAALRHRARVLPCLRCGYDDGGAP
jgi:hypothetical protein